MLNNLFSTPTNPFQHIYLPPRQKALMKDVLHAGKKGISVLQLHKKEHLGVAAGICRLRSRGFLFETERRDIYDRGGELRKRVTHYTLKGWCDDDYQILINQ